MFGIVNSHSEWTRRQPLVQSSTDPVNRSICTKSPCENGTVNLDGIRSAIHIHTATYQWDLLVNRTQKHAGLVSFAYIGWRATNGTELQTGLHLAQRCTTNTTRSLQSQPLTLCFFLQSWKDVERGGTAKSLHRWELSPQHIKMVESHVHSSATAFSSLYDLHERKFRVKCSRLHSQSCP